MEKNDSWQTGAKIYPPIISSPCFIFQIKKKRKRRGGGAPSYYRPQRPLALWSAEMGRKPGLMVCPPTRLTRKYLPRRLANFYHVLSYFQLHDKNDKNIFNFITWIWLADQKDFCWSAFRQGSTSGLVSYRITANKSVSTLSRG